MRIRKPISKQSGTARLLTAGGLRSVNYQIVTWGTFEGDKLCITERNGVLDGESEWPSGVAFLQMEDGSEVRILLRRCGSFAMCL